MPRFIIERVFWKRVQAGKKKLHKLVPSLEKEDSRCFNTCLSNCVTFRSVYFNSLVTQTEMTLINYQFSFQLKKGC